MCVCVNVWMCVCVGLDFIGNQCFYCNWNSPGRQKRALKITRKLLIIYFHVETVAGDFCHCLHCLWKILSYKGEATILMENWIQILWGNDPQRRHSECCSLRNALISPCTVCTRWKEGDYFGRNKKHLLPENRVILITADVH